MMGKLYNTILSILILFTFIHTNAQKWQSRNPGAGGRVQGVSCDPNTAGRMFVASDMEGFYYSNNYGTTWNWAAEDLPSAFILMATGRGNKFYVGHAKGLSISTNKGGAYTHVNITEDKMIGVIEIAPSNTNHIYCGVNWRGNDGHLSHYPQTTSGPREIYYSHNGGTSWEKSSWKTGNGDPRVHSITVDPTNTNDVLISTADGLYRSTNKGDNWSLIAKPSGTQGNACWGADLTVGGNWLYAIYRKGGRSELFVKQYPNGGWQSLGHGGWPTHNMWQPEVFQKSGNDHYVLIGQHDQNPNEGLHEGRFTVSGNNVSGSFTEILTHNGGDNQLSYDIGWNYYAANCRNNTYYPGNWNNAHTRGVFTQVQQSYFTGDAADGNTDWRIVSSGYVKTQNNIDFYRSRGTVSTFTYDVAVNGSYIIQGQADNLAMESWDNGGSWVQARTTHGVQDGHAVHVIPSNPAIVLMDASPGFGGGNSNGDSKVLYKEISNNSPNHNWERLGSNNNKKGLPSSRIWHFYADPNDYKRIYALTNVGLYICDDIVNLIENGSPNFRKIGTGSTRGHDLSFDPDNSNIVYYKDNQGIHKGTRSGNNYSWTHMTRSSGQTSNLNWGGLAVVKAGSNKYVYTYERYKGIVRAGFNDTQFEATAILADNDIFTVLDEPDWFDASHMVITPSEMEVQGNKIYFTYSVWEDVRWSFGVIRGTVAANGNVTWQDWTNDIDYAVARRVKAYNGRLYLATQGGGIQVRKLNGGNADALPAINENGAPVGSGSSGGSSGGDNVGETSTPVGNCNATSSGGKPNPPCNFFAEVISNTGVKLRWDDNSNNETTFEFQKYLQGDQWRGAGSSNANTEQIDRLGLDDGESYKFRIRAKNNSGASVWVEMPEWIDLDGVGGGSSSGGSNNGGSNTTSPVGNCSATSNGGKPNPPCSFTVEVLTNRSVKLVWNDNSNNESNFEIQKFVQGDQWRGGGSSAANTTNIIRNGLDENKKYRFRIRAKNNSGGSVWVEAPQVDLATAARFASPSQVSAPFMTIYPVPSTGAITVTSSMDAPAVIINATGQRVSLVNLKKGETNLNLSHLNRGVYMLLSERTRERIRFVIE